MLKLYEEKYKRPIINLRGMDFRGAKIFSLTENLKHREDIFALLLSENQIDDQAAIFLSGCIESMKGLTIIDLSYNHIGLRGAKKLKEIIQKCQKIQSCFLHHNQSDALQVFKEIKILTEQRTARIEFSIYPDDEPKETSKSKLRSKAYLNK